MCGPRCRELLRLRVFATAREVAFMQRLIAIDTALLQCNPSRAAWLQAQINWHQEILDKTEFELDRLTTLLQAP